MTQTSMFDGLAVFSMQGWVWRQKISRRVNSNVLLSTWHILHSNYR